MMEWAGCIVHVLDVGNAYKVILLPVSYCMHCEGCVVSTRRAGTFVCGNVRLPIVCCRGDPLSNLKVEFDTEDDAIAFCEKNGWKWFVQKQKEKELKPKSYGVNFSWNKRTRVSTK
jgi:hypothetical protein